MHFLILTQYFPPETGAAPIRLAAMTRELLRLGHTVEVVTALPNYPTGQIFSNYRGHFYMRDQWEEIPVHRVWMYAATGAGIKRLLNYFSFMLTAFYGLRKVQKKPDYLFVESPPLFLGITGYIVAQWWRRSTWILHIADPWPDMAQSLGLMRPGFLLRVAAQLEIGLYRKANAITVLTESVRQFLINNKQVTNHKVLLLPNAVDIQLFYPRPIDSHWKTSLGLPTDKQIILYAGTQGYAHGLEVILQAAQLLKEVNVLFLLIGGGSEKNRIQQLSQDLALNNVYFWPSQLPEEIARLYSLSLAGLASFRDVPLLESAIPAKMLPIMACGKPVLFSGAGEGAQLVREAKAGLVTAPGDPIALANAVQCLVNDPAYASQLGFQGRKYIEKHLQWSIVVADWLQQLLTNSSSSPEFEVKDQKI